MIPGLENWKFYYYANYCKERSIILKWEHKAFANSDFKSLEILRVEDNIFNKKNNFIEKEKEEGMIYFLII